MIKAIKRNKKQILLFLIAGVLSALIELIVFKFVSDDNALPSIFSFEKQSNGFILSTILASVFGIISNYFFSISFVFDNRQHSKKREFTYFVLLSIIAIGLNLIFFYLLVNILEIHPSKLSIVQDIPILANFKDLDKMFCKALAILLASVANFILKKKLIF